MAHETFKAILDLDVERLEFVRSFKPELPADFPALLRQLAEEHLGNPEGFRAARRALVVEIIFRTLWKRAPECAERARAWAERFADALSRTTPDEILASPPITKIEAAERAAERELEGGR